MGHLLNLGVSTVFNGLVLVVDILLQDEDGVLVVSGHWQLRDFNLTLLQVDDNLKVVLELLDTADGLALLVCNKPTLLFQLLDVFLVPTNERLEVLETPIRGFLLFIHLQADVTLFNNLVELLLNNGGTWTITVVIVNFLLFHLLDHLLNSEVVNSREGIQVNNVRLHLDALFNGHLNATLGLTLRDKLNVVLFDELLFTAVLLKLKNLFLLRLITGDLLLEVLHLVVAVLLEYHLFLEGLVKGVELLAVLVLRGTGFTAFVHHDDQADNVEFLLVDAVLEEETLLVEGEEPLLEFVFDVNDLISDVLEGELPCLTLLLFELLFLLEELTVALALVFGHFLVGLGHPVFADQLLLKQVLFLLECEFTAHHDLETTLADSITLELSLSFKSLTLFLSKSGTLLLSQVSLDFNLVVSNFENVLRCLKEILLLLVDINRLFQV